MWSDRLSPKQRQGFAARLRAILPAPFPQARGAKTPLRSGGRTEPSPLQVAEELREQPGFTWLDGGEEGHLLHGIAQLEDLDDAFLEELFGDDAADESSRAGDQDAHR